MPSRRRYAQHCSSQIKLKTFAIRFTKRRWKFLFSSYHGCQIQISPGAKRDLKQVEGRNYGSDAKIVVPV